ncbi:MAG: alpha/beta hydrolase [Thermodesulfovibrio sp.]|nr:alpha/beta hydrolase [Thermodesulfovibrio sp.]
MAERRNTYRHKLWYSAGLKMLLAVIVGMSFFLLILYLRQEKMIFFPQPVSGQTLNRIRSNAKNTEEISIRTGDGTIVRGWLVKKTDSAKLPLVIYFGGNAEEVSWLIDEAERFGGWALALINYRGYGSSEGVPGERQLLADALSIYDFFSARSDIDREKIAVMGRSLGSGVAVYLTHKRPVKGLLLITPYDSMIRVAQEKFPFLPVSLLLRHRFDSLSLAPLITQPMLALVAAEDTIIPPHHAKRLAESWAGPVTFVVIKGADHNSLDSHDQYWQSIKDFLSQLLPDASNGVGAFSSGIKACLPVTVAGKVLPNSF